MDTDYRELLNDIVTDIRRGIVPEGWDREQIEYANWVPAPPKPVKKPPRRITVLSQEDIAYIKANPDGLSIRALERKFNAPYSTIRKIRCPR